jgi:ATP-dependent RNA helicase DHX37/DHR1
VLQVPQFLFEGGYGCKEYPERGGMVGVTQPRRVAAVSTAKRVADELNTEMGDLVGYQVRYDQALGSGTAVKFMTDGILMREVQEDFLLKKCAITSLVIDVVLGIVVASMGPYH